MAGKTPGQIRAAIGRAVLKAGPDAARRRREEAEKDPRVELWREDAGTAAICGYGLPPDAALAADAAITTAALDLKAAGLAGTMDQLRARAYLDALLGQDSRPAPASPEHRRCGARSRGDPQRGARQRARPPARRPPARSLPARSPPRTQAAGAGTSGAEPAGAEAAGSGVGSPAPGTGSAQRDPAAAGADPDRAAPPEHGNDPAGPTGPAGHRTPGSGNGQGSPGGPGGATGPAARPTGPAGRAGTGPPPAAAINLTIPLTTLLGLTGHPGEAAAFGPIDAALARVMAAHAADNPATTWCITVTDEHGHPTAHGCAKPTRHGKRQRPTTPRRAATRDRTSPPGKPPRQPARKPAPHRLTGTGSGPPGGYGTWRLRLPGSSLDLTAALEPLAVTECDHRHQTSAHDPGRTLRHLVQIRDGECTYPPCLRAARRCDFEHAIAWEQGGRTCACNTGPRYMSY